MIFNFLKEYKWHLACFLFLLIVLRSIDFNGLYGQDAYAYSAYTSRLIEYFRTGAYPGNYYWPLFYPLCGTILSMIFSIDYSLQLISVASFILTAIYLEEILVIIFNTSKTSARIYCFLFLMLSPYVLRASIVVMSDSLCMCLIIAAFYYCLKYRELITGRHFGAFAFCSSAAIATRYGAVAILIVPTIFTGIFFIKNFNWKYALVSTLIVLALVIPHLLIAHPNPIGLSENKWLTGWNIQNLFSKSFDTVDGSASYLVWNIIYVFFNFVHPGFCFVGGLFILVGRKEIVKNFISSMPQKIVLISISIYMLFLGGIAFQNMRFLILSFSLVLIILYPGFIICDNYLKSKTQYFRNGLLIVIICFQLILFYRAFKPFYHYNKIEKQIAERILSYPMNQTLYTFSIDGALKHYKVKNPLVNMWETKIDSAKVPALLLFNEIQFQKQWENKNPMLNWNFIKGHYTIRKMEDLPDNWQLYGIE